VQQRPAMAGCSARTILNVCSEPQSHAADKAQASRRWPCSACRWAGDTLTGKGIWAQLTLAADRYRYLGERQVTTATNVTVDASVVLAVEVVDATPAPGPDAQAADCGANRLPH
jgi:hypothetical protein